MGLGTLAQGFGLAQGRPWWPGHACTQGHGGVAMAAAVVSGGDASGTRRVVEEGSIGTEMSSTPCVIGLEAIKGGSRVLNDGHGSRSCGYGRQLAVGAGGR
jgi:hypothetical protein